MYKNSKVANGVEVSIEITDDRKVVYAVGGNRTCFKLDESEILQGIEENHAHEGIAETVLWSAVYKGERRIERNKNHAEARRCISYPKYGSYSKMLASDEDVEGLAIRELEFESVVKSIRCLSREQQKLIGNVFFLGVSKADIARKDGVSNAAVSYRVERALKSLERFMQKQ